MKKTHIYSRIIQLHSESPVGEALLKYNDNTSPDMVLQIEPVEHHTADFMLEVINKKDYNTGMYINSALDTLERVLHDVNIPKDEQTNIIENQITVIRNFLSTYDKI